MDAFFPHRDIFPFVDDKALKGRVHEGSSLEWSMNPMTDPEIETYGSFAPVLACNVKRLLRSNDMQFLVGVETDRQPETPHSDLISASPSAHMIKGKRYGRESARGQE